ncbi:3-oxoacyl-(acyl-carrier-protein) synthase [Zhouia amylolytica]|uniref:3-oxoacyl-(Acyl-carrier-protein) synthase n=1 Tax=Zhouia amylolytica TaxID=376730 RepID=A0A1I6SGY1_9FLAO|nr:beta-ketoacyl synthase N-terminal-like domain-containing protein [Zhouia amylolytica]SFS76216.1 3-oxoacyl-(acyl-carrier-protein) synthase [Zhouia amylolytica]
MNNKVSIKSIASVSPLGIKENEIWQKYLSDEHCLEEREFGEFKAMVAPLAEGAKLEIEKLRVSDQKYKALDDTVLYAMYAARMAMKDAHWSSDDNFGVNMGSSRGATALFESYYEDFLSSGKTETLCSPTTTLGNISSWIAHDLQTKGPEISHSITCSTALHALLNGVAWINSGMTSKFMVGGSEASLTPFTIAQMKALKIYSRETDAYPCKALNPDKLGNTMVLGEGASVACLEKGVSDNAIAIIEGVGYATEVLQHNISISTNAECFQRSMKMALGNTSPSDVDVIVMHAPGTKKGDSSELNAIELVFGNQQPALTTNKWKVGHTFGASGMLSLELGIMMLQKQKFINVPYLNSNMEPEKIRKVMVNAVGFGGNAVSVLLSL